MAVGNQQVQAGPQGGSAAITTYNPAFSAAIVAGDLLVAMIQLGAATGSVSSVKTTTSQGRCTGSSPVRAAGESKR